MVLICSIRFVEAVEVEDHFTIHPICATAYLDRVLVLSRRPLQKSLEYNLHSPENIAKLALVLKVLTEDRCGKDYQEGFDRSSSTLR